MDDQPTAPKGLNYYSRGPPLGNYSYRGASARTTPGPDIVGLGGTISSGPAIE